MWHFGILESSQPAWSVGGLYRLRGGHYM